MSILAVAILAQKVFVNFFQLLAEIKRVALIHHFVSRIESEEELFAGQIYCL